jgi:LuxR family transcriptional regulator, maltose regulon positive regulatory protein
VAETLRVSSISAVIRNVIASASPRRRHRVAYRECRAALSVLADPVPDGSRLALAGRAEPPLQVARLRAEGPILEIGPGDLSLTRDEAASLLRDSAITLGEDDLAELHRRTEGWPAGLYLAALYLREGGFLPGAAVSFGGDDRLVSEYMESEFLTRISRHERAFLTRAAVLDRMSRPLCEAVPDLPGSAATMIRNRSLAKAISDCGWGTFRQMLQYKAATAGRHLIVSF